MAHCFFFRGNVVQGPHCWILKAHRCVATSKRYKPILFYLLAKLGACGMKSQKILSKMVIVASSLKCRSIHVTEQLGLLTSDHMVSG